MITEAMTLKMQTVRLRSFRRGTDNDKIRRWHSAPSRLRNSARESSVATRDQIACEFPRHQPSVKPVREFTARSSSLTSERAHIAPEKPSKTEVFDRALVSLAPTSGCGFRALRCLNQTPSRPTIPSTESGGDGTRVAFSASEALNITRT